MAHIAGVFLSDDREALIDYDWHITEDGSRLDIEVRVSHPVSSGLTQDDQMRVLQAVMDGVRHLGSQ